jgi:hypothetical protein
MKHRLYITRYIFITYVYELKGENHPGSFLIPPQALCIDPRFLDLSTSGGEWSALRPGRFTPGERALVPIGYEAGWAADLVCTTWRRENSCRYQDSNSNPCHPAHSQSPYRQEYKQQQV